jgi:hypothetical protein
MHRALHVRLTVSRFPGEPPLYCPACLTCGIPLVQTLSKGQAKRAARRHEREHARQPHGWQAPLSGGR